jgi:hypothetical protein
MAVFRFTINQSFLRNAGHPITVPKGQVPCSSLEAEGLNEKNVTLILPRGERFEGQLYHGEAGYGEYYQLQVRGENRTLPAYLKLQDRLLVVIFKAGSHSYAALEYRE